MGNGNPQASMLKWPSIRKQKRDDAAVAPAGSGRGPAAEAQELARLEGVNRGKRGDFDARNRH